MQAFVTCLKHTANIEKIWPSVINKASTMLSLGESHLREVMLHYPVGKMIMQKVREINQRGVNDDIGDVNFKGLQSHLASEGMQKTSDSVFCRHG